MLIYQNFKLPLEFLLLGLTRLAVVVVRQAGHILNHHQADFVAGTIKEVRLNFDMFSHHIEAEVLEHFQIVYHCLPIWRRVQAVRPKALIEGAKK